jgi:probable phosphoglycerate mutase
MEFGTWDGLTFAEVADRDREGLDGWVGSLETPPPGGESFREVEERVLSGLDALIASYPGQSVLVVSHVTPIKTLVARAIGAPLESVFRMELSPASVTVLSFWPEEDGRSRSSMRLYNARPPGDDAFSPAASAW